MRSLATALLALLVLAGCDTALDPSALPAAAPARVPSDSTYARLLRDVGGLDGLSRMLRTSSNEQLGATMAAHGIDFEVIDRDAAEALAKSQDITACPQLFPTADRGKWFRLVGAGGAEDHYIDSRGRPLTSYKTLGPITAAARQTTCQTNVGHWGDAGDTYDGGHMIGSQLGGWGGRANLVPQQYNFNRGNWLKIENKLATCGRLGNGAVEFHVDVDYPNTTTLTPSAFHADVLIAGVWKAADYTNTTSGGASGTTQSDNMVSWLNGKGCY